VLRQRGQDAKVYVAMRAWHPMCDEVAQAVASHDPDVLVLLPLYPQYSTTTTASAITAWLDAAKKKGLSAVERRVCCYPWEKGFVTAISRRVCRALAERKTDIEYRILFSAHGLPQRTVTAGDPYQWQVERTVQAIVAEIGADGFDWRICYQSRVGPLRWLEPATDAEIGRAGGEGKGVIVVPVAFVSEHSETLVELDMDYAKLARDSGVVDYIRVPTVGTDETFIDGLADLVLKAVVSDKPVSCGEGRICPALFGRCGMAGSVA
jgi:protoporphyrin/coproporphyrin ferrochelatase